MLSIPPSSAISISFKYSLSSLSFPIAIYTAFIPMNNPIRCDVPDLSKSQHPTIMHDWCFTDCPFRTHFISHLIAFFISHVLPVVDPDAKHMDRLDLIGASWMRSEWIRSNLIGWFQSWWWTTWDCRSCESMCLNSSEWFGFDAEGQRDWRIHTANTDIDWPRMTLRLNWYPSPRNFRATR